MLLCSVQYIWYAYASHSKFQVCMYIHTVLIFSIRWALPFLVSCWAVFFFIFDYNFELFFSSIKLLLFTDALLWIVYRYVHIGILMILYMTVTLYTNTGTVMYIVCYMYAYSMYCTQIKHIKWLVCVCMILHVY
jgi:hypothetical protein